MAELLGQMGQAAPEVRAFVTWAGLEMCDHLTRDFVGLGLPPLLARREAENATRILVRRVLGVAKAFHQWGV